MALGEFHVQAQWLTQEIRLQPGWNCVHLEVQPEPADCATVLAGLGVESVWAWNRRFTAMEFIKNPNELLPTTPDWLVYLPNRAGLAGEHRLYAMDGGRAYIIKMPSDSQARVWRIQGKAAARPISWVPESLNLVGFQVAGSATPTFDAFFRASTAHTGQPILRLRTDGFWSQVTSPQTERLSAGEAFWIGCHGISDYQGPIRVGLEQVDRMDFGRAVIEQTLRVKNLSSLGKDVVVRLLPSENPLAAAESANFAGPVSLLYQRYDQAAGRLEWTNLPARLDIVGLQSGEERTLRLAVRRKDMADRDGVFQSLIEITEASGGFRFVVPVTAQGRSQAGQTDLRLGKQSITPSPWAGLWIGSAIIRKVNQPANTQAPELPLETKGSEFQFRLIIHVDTQGQARLLQHVVQMWKEGTYELLPGSPDIRQVVEPGRDVLITDDNLLRSGNGLKGVTLVDGKPVGRRFSSAAFGFRDPKAFSPLSGFGTDGTILACILTNDYRTDPLNPFVHKYHPNHDNLDRTRQRVLDEGEESFTIVRTIRLEFRADDEEWRGQPGWQDTLLGGTYRENLAGLHRIPLITEGKFLLRRAGWASELNSTN